MWCNGNTSGCDPEKHGSISVHPTQISYNNIMKITIETNESKVSIDVPELVGNTRETWEKQGYEIFQKCIEYIFKKENINTTDT